MTLPHKESRWKRRCVTELFMLILQSNDDRESLDHPQSIGLWLLQQGVLDLGICLNYQFSPATGNSIHLIDLHLGTYSYCLWHTCLNWQLEDHSVSFLSNSLPFLHKQWKNKACKYKYIIIVAHISMSLKRIDADDLMSQNQERESHFLQLDWKLPPQIKCTSIWEMLLYNYFMDFLFFSSHCRKYCTYIRSNTIEKAMHR